MGQNITSRWRHSHSAILIILWFLSTVSAGLPIFHRCVKFDAKKCWLNWKLWPKFEIHDGGRPPYCIGIVFFHHWTNFGAKIMLYAELWAKIENKDGGRPPCYIFENWFLSNRSPWSADFLSRFEFGARKLIDAEIMAENRNTWWWPSAILEFRKSEFWDLGPLWLLIFHHYTKFVSKM